MSGNLDGFLGSGEDEEEGAPPSEQEQRPPEPEGKEQPEAEREEEPPPPSRDGRNVPLAALEAERKQRQDWKDRAARAETLAAEHEKQLAEMRRQLEEVRKAPPPAPPPPVQRQPEPPLPDPETNPAGYVAALIERQQAQAQQMIVAERFNASEARLRDKIGDEAVDAMVAEFQQAAQQDPMLGAALHQQRDPFAWAHKQMQARRAQREIGDDPAAYRARLEAELREKIAAEMAAAAPPPPQRPAVPRLQPSLANGRSAAPRGLGEDNDDTDVPMADILRR